MSETHFERLMRQEMGKISDSAIKLPFSDPLKVACDLARLQGRYSACQTAIEVYRREAKIDVDQDDL